MDTTVTLHPLGPQNLAAALSAPARQAARMCAEGTTQLVDYQTELAGIYSRFAIGTMRDLLGIGNTASLEHLFERRAQAFLLLGRDLSRCTEQAVEKTQRTAQHAVERRANMTREGGNLLAASLQLATQKAAQTAERAMR